MAQEWRLVAQAQEENWAGENGLEAYARQDMLRMLVGHEGDITFRVLEAGHAVAISCQDRDLLGVMMTDIVKGFPSAQIRLTGPGEYAMPLPAFNPPPAKWEEWDH